MRDIMFGAAYYEEYHQEDRLERDMILMREAGMNTIRIAESTWSVEEPRRGEYDFSHVIRVIEAAARHGINVIIGTPTYAIPKWLYDLDPDMLGNNPFGPRQNMDITNPTYRHYAERIIRELVSRTAGFANVIGFQIDNETKHYGVNNQRVREGFRSWLKERFGTIEALNFAYGLNHWSNSVASFDELPDPAGAVNGSYACAFEEYRRELATQFLHWQADIVSEYKRPDQFITHNLDFEWRFFGAKGQQDGYSWGVQPDRNDFEVAKALTLAGTDVYCPPCDDLTGVEIAFGGDIIRPLKRAPYLVLESQSQAFTDWQPYPGQLRLMALSHLASGACGVMYWPWASIHNGIESYWKGILSHDGEPGETYREIAQIGAELQKLTPILSGQRKTCRIAMIVSPEALHAMRWFPTDKATSYNDIVMSVYRAFYELNLECDILYDREQDWHGYDLIVFPELYCCLDELIEHVRDYVQSGGTVFATFRSFFTNENLKIWKDRQPHGLTDVFGMHYSRFAKTKDGKWMDLLEPDEAETVSRYEHQYWGKYASATHHRYGHGHAWYLGTMPDRNALMELLQSVCASAGIPVFTGANLPLLHWPIVIRSVGDVHFLLNYSSQAQRFPCPFDGKDVLTGKALHRGEQIELPDWGAIVMV